MQVEIDPQLRAAAPDLVLATIVASAEVAPCNDELSTELDRCGELLRENVRLEDVTTLPPVRALREAYRALGKDASRYRGSNEALLRRALQGKGLPHVNTVVDINNLLSLETRHPVGSYDVAKIRGAVMLRAGRAGERYEAVGKSELDLEHLPLLVDEDGPFGSPSSDSRRALISEQTRAIAMVIFAFTGIEHIGPALDRAVTRLRKHAHVITFEVVQCR